jgi:predicted nucleic acid-binding protein
MLVDTSVWIDFFNGHASAQADRLAQAIADGEAISLPGVVIAEVLAGLKDDREAKRIAGLLSAFDMVLELSVDDYVAASAIYRLCRTKGFTVRSMIDCLIAQLCLRDRLAILTKDRDFEAIAKCVPLQRISV